MHRYYKLDGKEIVVCRDMMEWAKWFEASDRHVALTKIAGIRVSTVFLGIDHNFSFNGDPLLFETMIFIDGWAQDEMRRYCTYEEAEIGHAEIVKNIKLHSWNLIVLPWVEFIWRNIVLAKLQVVINKIWELRDKIKSRMQCKNKN
jgi:hypothetical protein